MDNFQINIRNATLEDVAAIAALSGQLGYQSSTDETEKRLKDILHSREHMVYVACDNRRHIIGWIHVFSTLRVETDTFCEIGGLIVAASARGQGVGTQLLAAARNWAEQNGIYRLRVRSRIERSGAKQFYSRMGFSISKVQTVFDLSLRNLEVQK